MEVHLLHGAAVPQAVAKLLQPGAEPVQPLQTTIADQTAQCSTKPVNESYLLRQP